MKDWSDAATSCLAHGGNLASIEDPDEQKFIQSNTEIFRDRHLSFWMGLFKTHKGEWMWLDKTVMDYSNWDLGQPGYRTYGLIGSSDGTWHTGNQRFTKPYICKTPKVLPPQPSSSSPQAPQVTQDRSHKLLAVLFTAGIVLLAGIVFALFKRSGHHLSIPGRIAHFDNPLFSNKRSDLVDIKKLVENVD